MQQRGFTLLESVVVVAIAGLLLALAVPAFLHYGATLAGREARVRLMQDLRFARQLAITAHTPVVVAFGDGVGTTGITSYTLHADLNGDRVRQANETRSAKALPKGTQIIEAALVPTDSVIFDTSGGLHPASSGGRLVVSTGSSLDTLLVSPTGVVYRL